MSRFRPLLTIATLAFTGTLTLADYSFVCREPGGKRVVQIDGSDISPVDGKIALRIDPEGYINDASGKHVLYVSDDDVRLTPAGIKLMTFDGEDFRHGKGGKVVLNYHEKDVCPSSSENRIYTIEGDALSKKQFIAAMYFLKPELFKLTPDEEAEQKKGMANAAAEQDKIDHADQFAGEWMVLNSSGVMEKLGQGSITVGPKKGDAYLVAFDWSKGDGPKFSGVAMSEPAASDDQTFVVAYGTPKTVALCRYEISGGTLKGQWQPWYADGDAKNVGMEILSGPASLDGEFKIDSGKVATTGAAYTGTVAIHPLDITGAPSEEKPYSLDWTIGGAKIKGIGIRVGKYLYAATGTGADVCIAKYVAHNGNMNSDWYKLGVAEHGQAAATKMN